MRRVALGLLLTCARASAGNWAVTGEGGAELDTNVQRVETGPGLDTQAVAAAVVRLGARAEQLIRGVEREDWRFVALVRLVPLVPFNLLNYALGLTRVRVSRYMLASYLAMLPGTFAYTYLGYAGRAALAGQVGLLHKGLIALALLACAALLPRIIRRLRTPRPGDGAP